MRIELKHSLGKEEAIRRIDDWLDALSQGPIPAGIKIEDFTKSWSGNVLTVSCRMKKFFVGATVSAAATVNEDVVIVEAELPGFLKALVSDEKILTLWETILPRLSARVEAVHKSRKQKSFAKDFPSVLDSRS